MEIMYMIAYEVYCLYIFRAHVYHICSIVTVVTWMSQAISKKPLKITSLKQIYLQIEKNIHKTALTLKRSDTSLSIALIVG